MDLKKYSVESLRNQISIVQQEPLLFNETIKSNILFGRLDADNRHINDAATRANAMAFIMQSNDDMNSPVIQQAIKQEFKTMMSRIQSKIFTFKEFATVERLVDTSQLSYKSLAILTLMLPNINQDGLKMMNESFDKLVRVLELKSPIADCTWQGVVKGFMFLDVSEMVNAWLVGADSSELDYSISKLSEEYRREIRAALRSNETEFDAKTINEFCEHCINPGLVQ